MQHGDSRLGIDLIENISAAGFMILDVIGFTEFATFAFVGTAELAELQNLDFLSSFASIPPLMRPIIRSS